MKQIKVGGIGNVLLGDDGVGPYAVRLLEQRFSFPENVEVVDLGTPGLGFIAQLTGMDALILIDSVENGKEPGTVTLYRREDITRHLPMRLDPHAPALTESLLIADMTGECPADVLLIGITGADYTPSFSLSEAAQLGAERAIDEVLRELARLRAGFTTRKPAASELAPVGLAAAAMTA